MSLGGKEIGSVLETPMKRSVYDELSTAVNLVQKLIQPRASKTIN